MNNNNAFERIIDKIKKNISTEAFNNSKIKVSDGIYWQRVRRASDIKRLVKNKLKKDDSAKSS